MSDVQRAERGLLNAGVLIPFLLISLIWGSTWLVIRDQLSVVPTTWSVTYRFTIAALGMFALAIVTRQKIRINRATHIWAIMIGFVQFAINFNFVYAAEHYITSGLVAVLFALLIVPNAIFGKIWLGRDITKNFMIGSAIASIGVAMLIIQEYRDSPVGAGSVLMGAGLTICAVFSASTANTMLASTRLAQHSVFTILAWSMLYGTIANAILSMVTVGPPILEYRMGYIGGIVYLAILGSVVTFPLYMRLMRDIGPGKAAYTSVLIPVVAMLLSTVFEDYKWSSLSIGGAAFAIIGMLYAMQAAKPAR